MENIERETICYCVVGPSGTLWKENDCNSLPNDKILDKSKLKAIADDKINVTKD